MKCLYFVPSAEICAQKKENENESKVVMNNMNLHLESPEGNKCYYGLKIFTFFTVTKGKQSKKKERNVK